MTRRFTYAAGWQVRIGDADLHVEGAHFFDLPFAGHEVHRDAPQMFLLAVADFLARPRRRQGDTL